MNRAIAGLTCAAMFVASTAPATRSAQADPGRLDRQRQYQDAAVTSGVPLAVLLAVSYLESRWDTNRGQQSTSGGYGPMDLTEVAGPRSAATGSAPVAGVRTLDLAARLTRVPKGVLRDDAAANIRGGAAVLARYQRDGGEAGGAVSPLGRWYGAVARYSGATDAGTAANFADEVYATLSQGAQRRTDDGRSVTLPATAATPDRDQLDRPGWSHQARSPQTQCPVSLSCQWIPAAHQLLGDGKDPTKYGHYDIAHRTASRRTRHQPPIRYIIIHDTESSYHATIKEVQDPAWPASWNYTIRSADGHVAQHVRLEDVSWNSGNWYINSQAIGIEHEGYAAAPDAWYTEAMYESSARLVRYLARIYHIPLDRAHILGHDDVPSPSPDKVLKMHRDPGPYWDWAHYFDLLGAPLAGRKSARARPAGRHACSGLTPHHPQAPRRCPGRANPRRRSEPRAVLVAPRYLRNVITFTGCTAVALPCPPHGSSELLLHIRPSAGAPLLPDAGLHPDGSPSTMGVLDEGARVSTGQRFAVAGRQGHWISIWYQGRTGWLADPPFAPTVIWSPTALMTPKPGLASIPVYGRAYPESAAYPVGTTAEPLVELPYRLLAGEWYTVAGAERSMFYRARSFDGSVPGDRTLVCGHRRYMTIQFGHRLAFVDAATVTVRLPKPRVHRYRPGNPAPLAAPPRPCSNDRH